MISRFNDVETAKLLNILNYGSSFDLQFLDFGKVEDCLKRGCDPNVRNYNGDATIHLIVDCMQNFSDEDFDNDFLEKLVSKYGANIHLRDGRGLTPIQKLLDSSLYKFWEGYRFLCFPIRIVSHLMSLIRLGANPNSKNKWGIPVLHSIVREMEHINGISKMTKFDDKVYLQQYFNFEIYAKELIQKYAVDIHAQDSGFKTIVQIKMDAMPSIKPSVGNNDIYDHRWRHILCLISLGASVDTINEDGLPLLHFFQTLPELKKYFDTIPKEDFNIDVRDQDGYTLFQKSLIQLDSSKNEISFSDNLNFCEWLIQKGADYSLKNPKTNEFFSDMLQKFPFSDIGRPHVLKINELDRLIYEKVKEARNEFISLLILFVRAHHKGNQQSMLLSIPKELLVRILSFCAASRVQKSHGESYDLCSFFFAFKKEEIFPLKNHGIKVCQFSQSLTTKGDLFSNSFFFFEKVKDFCEDYPSFKEEIKSQQVRKNPITDWFLGKELTNTSIKTIEDRAISVWNSHSSIFKKNADKKNLWNSIKNREPYSNAEIQKKIIDQLCDPEEKSEIQIKKS